MTPDRVKRRARRIAADEAHAWARNLRVRNTLAKFVLCTLTQYVDGDGVCFVSIPTLAEDTELNAQTIRNRLAFLEDELGVISRTPQWIDERGHRNSDERGRRTSDNIRLMIDLDETAIEKRANGARRVAADEESDPMHGIGSRAEGGSADTVPALCRPSDSGQGLISEPEPEPESPLAPPGNEREPADDEEPEGFAESWQAWPGHEVMGHHRHLAVAEFRKLPPEKRRLCRAAIPHFVKMQTALKRDTVPNFHIWIRHGGFNEFPNAALDAETGHAVMTTSFDAASAEGRALKTMFAFARTLLFEHKGCVVYPLPVTAQVLAFADAPDRASWPWIEDRAQIARWSMFLSAHIHRARPDLLTKRGDSRGFYAPWPWPPRKDGTISQLDTGDAA